MISLKEVRGKTTAVFTFGRMNPPTAGHEKLIKKTESESQKLNADLFVFLSRTKDAEENPLTPQQKSNYLKLGIPTVASSIITKPSIKTPFDALDLLIQRGYKKIIFMVGSDRVPEFKKNMKSYINREHPEIEFNVVSAGDRDPDSRGVSGVSASKMRSAAKNKNFNFFSKFSLSGLNPKQVKSLYNDVSKNMKLMEEITESILDPGNTLDMPRHKMPQIRQEDIPEFIEFLKNKGVGVLDTRIRISGLKPTQKELNVQRVHDKMDSFVRGVRAKKLIVSRDNRILDGHHQLFALKLINRKFVPAFRVNINMKELLKLAHSFPKVGKKTID